MPGVEGYPIGRYGEWSRNFDRFVGVNFPGITILDVLWTGLEIIDEDYLREQAEAKRAKMEALKSATNVVLTVGPRGGFRYLSYEYTDADGLRRGSSTGSGTEAEELQEFFAENSIHVRRVVQL